MTEKEDSTRGIKLILEEWKVVIQTQMHFNEMLMQMRTAGVTIVLAVFGAAAYSLQYDKLFLTISTYRFHVSVLIIAFGLGMLLGVFCLDYFYYYKMLLGAVERGYEIDKAFKDKSIDGYKIFGMSTMIRDSIGKPKRSKYFVWLFYGLVFLLGALFIVGVLLGYAPTFNGDG
jgi:uncharacterized membrane protein YwzB